MLAETSLPVLPRKSETIFVENGPTIRQTKKSSHDFKKPRQDSQAKALNLTKRR